MTDLFQCPECKKDFSEHLIQPMYISGHSDIKDRYYLMCPLCALKVRNNLAGIPEDTPFKGTMANEYWEEATKYARKNH